MGERFDLKELHPYSLPWPSAEVSLIVAVAVVVATIEMFWCL